MLCVFVFVYSGQHGVVTATIVQLAAGLTLALVVAVLAVMAFTVFRRLKALDVSYQSFDNPFRSIYELYQYFVNMLTAGADGLFGSTRNLGTLNNLAVGDSSSESILPVLSQDPPVLVASQDPLHSGEREDVWRTRRRTHAPQERAPDEVWRTTRRARAPPVFIEHPPPTKLTFFDAIFAALLAEKRRHPDDPHIDELLEKRSRLLVQKYARRWLSKQEAGRKRSVIGLVQEMEPPQAPTRLPTTESVRRHDIEILIDSGGRGDVWRTRRRTRAPQERPPDESSATALRVQIVSTKNAPDPMAQSRGTLPYYYPLAQWTPATVTYFKIQCARGAATWVVERRFRSFVEVRARLALELDSSVELPSLPPKLLSHSPDAIATRWLELEAFLQACLRNPIVAESRGLYHFLTEEWAPIPSVISPTRVHVASPSSESVAAGAGAAIVYSAQLTTLLAEDASEREDATARQANASFAVAAERAGTAQERAIWRTTRRARAAGEKSPPPDKELVAAAQGLDGRFTFESLLGKLLSQRREAEMEGIEVDEELQKQIDCAATLRVQAAARRMLCRKAAREARAASTTFGDLKQRSNSAVPSLSKLTLKQADKKPSTLRSAPPVPTEHPPNDTSRVSSVPLSLPPSPPASPTRSTLPPAPMMGEVAMRRSVQRSSVQRETSMSRRSSSRKTSLRKSVLSVGHPEVGQLQDPVANAVVRVSVKMGKPFGVRHAASAAAWYDSLTADDQERIVSTYKSAKDAAKKKGKWSASSKREVVTFMGGFGELFGQRHGGHRYQLFPNYLYFVIEMVHIATRVLVLSLPLDGDAQCWIVTTLDAVELVVFTIQQPFTDRYLNLDIMLVKAQGIVNFVLVRLLPLIEPRSALGGGWRPSPGPFESLVMPALAPSSLCVDASLRLSSTMLKPPMRRATASRPW